MFKAAKLQARVEALELEKESTRKTHNQQLEGKNRKILELEKELADMGRALEKAKKELEEAQRKITDYKSAESRALQWANMMTYTGKPQSMEGVHDD